MTDRVQRPRDGRSFGLQREANHRKRFEAGSRTTVVNVILDGSGSMADVLDATIGGYNEYINGLKIDGHNYKVSLTIFDSQSIDHPYTALDINEVPKLDAETYQPRDGTPLYDAVCSTLIQAQKTVTKKDKSLVVIITDGMENMSHEFTEKDMKRLKEQLEEQGNWSFVYLGANQDAWDTAQKWGFAQQNVATYNSTDKGTQAIFNAASLSTQAFAGTTSMRTANFLSTAQQEDIKKTK